MLVSRDDFCIVEEMEENNEGKIKIVDDDGEFKRGKVVSCGYIKADTIVIYRNGKKLGLGHPNFVVVEKDDVIATERENGE